MFLDLSTHKMYRLVLLSALLVSAIANPTLPLSRLGGRIVGGKNASIKNAPYQVLIQAHGIINCGGSIISEDLVLTAAHCVEMLPLRYMSIRAGSTNAGEGGSVHEISDSYSHKLFDTNKYGVPSNDIAVLKVSTPFKFDETRQPIPLFAAGAEAKPGTPAVISGWGTLWNEGPTSKTLQNVTLPILSKVRCNKAYKFLGGLPKGQLCTAPQKGKDACQGDSGGPLAVDGTLAGIVSWGLECASGNPGVFTEVAYYRDWIKTVSLAAHGVNVRNA